MKKLFAILWLLLFSFIIQAQDIEVYPTHWWVGMKWNTVQLMIRGKNIAESVPMVKMRPEGMALAPGVRLKQIDHAENKNYVFLILKLMQLLSPAGLHFLL